MHYSPSVGFRDCRTTAALYCPSAVSVVSSIVFKALCSFLSDGISDDSGSSQVRQHDQRPRVSPHAAIQTTSQCSPLSGISLLVFLLVFSVVFPIFIFRHTSDLHQHLHRHTALINHHKSDHDQHAKTYADEKFVTLDHSKNRPVPLGRSTFLCCSDFTNFFLI